MFIWQCTQLSFFSNLSFQICFMASILWLLSDYPNSPWLQVQTMTESIVNVFHDGSVLGATREHGVALVKFSFLIQMTLTEHPRHASHIALCFLCGFLWGDQHSSRWRRELPNARKFQKNASAVELTPEGGLLDEVQSGRALRTLRKCMNQDSKIWNIENSRIRSFIMLIFIVKDGDVSVLD